MRSSGLYAFPQRVFFSGADAPLDMSDIAKCGLFPPRKRKIQTGAFSFVNRSAPQRTSNCIRNTLRAQCHPFNAKVGTLP